MAIQAQDEILADAANAIAEEYLYLQVDTSTAMPARSAVELTNGGTQIGNTASLFNKVVKYSQHNQGADQCDQAITADGQRQ